MEKPIKHLIDIEYIKALMEAKSIKVKEMARLMEVCEATLRRLLNGADQSRMSPIIVYKIAVTLNVKMHDLLLEKYR